MRDDTFEALRDKYVEMRAMRLAHEAGEDADARARMRALASRFPGALREIDELPLAEIERRIARLDAGERPGWALTLSAYHGWMRVALRIKRTHDRGTDVGHVLEWLRAEHRPSPDEPSLAELDERTVASILRPPRGRLSRWVIERIARDRGQTVDEVSAEAFDTGNA